MKPFAYCPACASLLEQQGDDGGRLCSVCGRTWYQSPSPTVGAAIVRDGQILLTVRGIEPQKGKLDVPGGFLNPGEHPLDGLRREMGEELGIEIEVGFDDFVQAIPHTYGEEEDWVLSAGFVARIAAGEPRPADDVAGARWATLEELDDLDFAWEHDRDLARAALERVRERST